MRLEEVFMRTQGSSLLYLVYAKCIQVVGITYAEQPSPTIPKQQQIKLFFFQSENVWPALMLPNSS